MPPAPHDLRREDLIGRLRAEGYRISNHQLLRWVDAGLLPNPRRTGKGRGRGTEVYYPRVALLQARTLVRLLRDNRNLDDAGWGLWALGFPLTEWARELMLDELKALKGAFEREDRRYRAGKPSLLDAAGKRRPPRRLVQMRKAVKPDKMPRVLAMTLRYQLGTFRAREYSAEDWDRYRDAVLGEYLPELLDDPGLPTTEEVAPALEEESRQFGLGRTISALKHVEAHQLEQYRNECQWLTELFSRPDEPDKALMARPDFITFFKGRHMAPEGDANFRAFMRSIGQTRAPASPLQRWVAAGRAKAASPRTPTP